MRRTLNTVYAKPARRCSIDFFFQYPAQPSDVLVGAETVIAGTKATEIERSFATSPLGEGRMRLGIVKKKRRNEGPGVT